MRDGNGNIVLTENDKLRSKGKQVNLSIRARNHAIKCKYTALLLTCTREENHPGSHFDHLVSKWFGYTKEGELMVFDGGELDA